jgi:predicted transcriptional regulator
MNARVLKLLLAGEYICPVRYRMEFESLGDTSEREEVDAWLLSLGMRLARLGDEGAFFLAHDHIGQKEITQVKNELLKFRDEYGPAVLLLDFIRQADAGRVQLTPGEYIVLYQLEAAVSQSSMLETQLKGLLGVITNAAMRNTNHENLRRLLDHLARDGYVVLANKDTGAYQVTGKIEQLYAVLQFLDESKVVPDTEVDDREEVQEDLVDSANAGEGAPL